MTTMHGPENCPSSEAAHDNDAKVNEVPQDAEYAFLVHSRESLSQGSSPSIDNQRLVRQKRRRTRYITTVNKQTHYSPYSDSPQDHAFLEAAYDRNPKPDKAARQDIVKHVALGEKEVQIWFQNRRQMTRRKSKPVSDHDLDIGLHSGQSTSQKASSTFSTSTSNQQHLSQDQNSLSTCELPLSPNELGPDNSQEGFAAKSGSSSNPSQAVCQTFKMDDSGTMRPRDAAESFKSLSPSKRKQGSLANRRNASFIIHDEAEDSLAPSQKSLSQETSSQDGASQDAVQVAEVAVVPRSSGPLRRSASMVKLSMNADGKAEVAARSGLTPSPPHQKAVMLPISPRRPKSGLQRSFSAADAGSSQSAIARSTIGRSRDARVWEFYCDSDARDALTKQAEREASGSATAAIGLIRSHSNNGKSLTPNPNKRNAKVQRHESVKKVKAAHTKSNRPSSGRASSSVARMQTDVSNGSKPKSLSRGLKPASGKAMNEIFEDFDGDSDKENWKPGTQTRPPPRRRPVTSQESARILLESLREPSGSSSQGSGRQCQPHEKAGLGVEAENGENRPPELDEEVARFMGAETTPRREEDLDCVQNLLSLSQAAWN